MTAAEHDPEAGLAAPCLCGCTRVGSPPGAAGSPGWHRRTGPRPLLAAHHDVTAWEARHYPGHTLAVRITRPEGTP